jgi:aquaporin NIP
MLQMLLTHKALAEIIGTFTMIFIGGGSIILSERHLLPSFCIPIAWGLIIALMIFAVGHISGAHLNPAVTLAFMVTKRIPFAYAPVYWTSQFVGGLTAVCLLEVLKKV